MPIKTEVVRGWTYLRAVLQSEIGQAADSKRRDEVADLIALLNELPEAERYAWVHELMTNDIPEMRCRGRRPTKRERYVRAALLTKPMRSLNGFLYPCDFDGDALSRSDWIKAAEG